MIRFAFRICIFLTASPFARAAVPRLSVEAMPVSVVAAPAAVAAFPAAPLPLTAAASAPSILAAPSLEAAPAPVTAAPAPAGAGRSVAPRDRDFSSWTLPKEDSGNLTFRDSWFRSARLWDGADPARLLGEGAMGSVFVHPSRPDAIVKVARTGYAEAAGQYMAPDDEVILAYEDYDLDRLAALGAAPRPLSRLTISGRPASVRERIYGRTVSGLARRGLFGPRELSLVHELIRRIAAGGLTARDMNLGNIMIGRRGGDAEERAWLVDTLGVHAREGTDAQRREEMLAEPVPWLAINGFGLARPLGRMLDANAGR
ncbi:MAG: hypothetical protein HYV14_08495 [Elusimicrobia bacterium]|nr:hypothetical protein [Elusimicrobiota bacterium]